jgi:hypothetical protein
MTPTRRAAPSPHQVERLEAFGEPIVDWREQIAGGIALALIAAKPRHANCRA